MVDAFGSQRVNVKPPERGVFALDHDQECKETMKVYLSCLRNNNTDHIHCRDLAQAYLACRMERGLMRPENFEDLGFHSSSSNSDSKQQVSTNETDSEKQGGTGTGTTRIDRSVLTPDSKEMKGWVAGTSVKTYNKWKFW